jgi:hypothetical protein
MRQALLTEHFREDPRKCYFFVAGHRERDLWSLAGNCDSACPANAKDVELPRGRCAGGLSQSTDVYDFECWRLFEPFEQKNVTPEAEARTEVNSMIVIVCRLANLVTLDRQKPRESSASVALGDVGVDIIRRSIRKDVLLVRCHAFTSLECEHETMALSHSILLLLHERGRSCHLR